MEFDYDDELAAAAAAAESVAEREAPVAGRGGGGAADGTGGDDEYDAAAFAAAASAPQPPPPPQQQQQQQQRVAPYDPAAFDGLDAPPDARELFAFIERFRPPLPSSDYAGNDDSNSDLPAPLAPFIPDYEPALGGVDDFVKVPRPDGRPDFLGLRVLDEAPPAAQSDPAVVALRVRALGGRALGGAAGGCAPVGRVDADGGGDQAARARAIDAWIASVAGAAFSLKRSAVRGCARGGDQEGL